MEDTVTAYAFGVYTTGRSRRHLIRLLTVDGKTLYDGKADRYQWLLKIGENDNALSEPGGDVRRAPYVCRLRYCQKQRHTRRWPMTNEERSALRKELDEAYASQVALRQQCNAASLEMWRAAERQRSLNTSMLYVSKEIERIVEELAKDQDSI
jgi:hypothetical protein